MLPGAVSLRLDRIRAAETARATWIDPRTGARTPAGAFPTAAPHAFPPPQGWLDALLLVEAQERDKE